MSETGFPWVVNTSNETFQADVLDRSREVPVVVDFWAEWCQPCRILGPILESLAQDFGGRFILVKAETEQMPEIAGQFRVEGIPAVYAVLDGEIVDFFVGALPKEQIRDWLERVIRASGVIAAQKLEASDPAAAEQQYRELHAQLPNESTIAIGLARVLLAQDRDADARQIIEQLERRGFLEPEAEKVKAALELRSQKTPDLDACRAAFAANPQDLALQLQLGEALAARQQYREALDVLLGIVAKDKKGVGEQARQLVVDIFRVVPDEELVREYRRRLTTLLY